jgi:hypothetical protein
MLRLEFLPSGFAHSPLLRLAGDDPIACARLREAFEQLADGNSEKVCISELPGIEPIDCRLTASIGRHNRGVVAIDGLNSFDWQLTTAGWDNNASLIEPFCQRRLLHSFQWLDSPSDIAVLFSPTGQW